jgi:Peptidase family C25
VHVSPAERFPQLKLHGVASDFQRRRPCYARDLALTARAEAFAGERRKSVVGNVAKAGLLVLALSIGCSSDDCPADRPVFVPWSGCHAPDVSTASEVSYAALIVTDDAHRDAFARLAQLHTLTGVPTRVVTVEDICRTNSAGCRPDNPCNDTAKAIKDYLVRGHADGLGRVVLGGSVASVPSRQTHDAYANPLLGVSYQDTFYTDYYFADLSEWDSDGDCVYGDPTGDAPDYEPELAVTRIPISDAAALEAYIAKVERYLTSYDTTRIGTVLFLSNLATEIDVPFTSAALPVDSAVYFETAGRTLSLVPADFAVSKLYAAPADGQNATPLTVATETAAFESGANLVIHAGHGSVQDLTVEFDGSNAFTAPMAQGLSNRQFPILLSSACNAAAFANRSGCAGTSFISAPDGGGIGYLGNSPTGLGLAGGMQLIDAFLAYVFSTPSALAGDAVMAGHAQLPTSDSFLFSGLPIVGTLSVPVIDIHAWRWTQKAVAYLGDGLVPVYTNTALAPAPAFSVTSERLGNFVTLTLQPEAPVPGTLMVAMADKLYSFALTDNEAPISLTIASGPTELQYGFSSPNTLARIERVSLP